MSQLLIISGVSGSGKSTALNALEDMGYFCVHNLPAQLLMSFVDFFLGFPDVTSRSWSEARQSLVEVDPSRSLDMRYALLLDWRVEDDFYALVREAVKRLEEAGAPVELLFFDCQDEVVIRRFRETRRPHPVMLSGHTVATISEALRKERELLAEFRAAATRVIDTSSYTPHDLRRVMEEYCGHEPELRIEVLSFGYKYGIPHDADLVVDVRFLPNPYFVAGLKELSGEDAGVRDYIFQTGEAEQFLKCYRELLDFLIGRYQTEGKRYLTIAIGCTGGRHRSVALAEELGVSLIERNPVVTVRHRDIERLR